MHARPGSPERRTGWATDVIGDDAIETDMREGESPPTSSAILFGYSRSGVTRVEPGAGSVAATRRGPARPAAVSRCAAHRRATNTYSLLASSKGSPAKPP